MKNASEKNTGSRRSFLRHLPAVPVLSASLATVPEPASAQTDSPLSAQADALAEVARLRFGVYLKDGDMADIRRGIERNLWHAQAISQVKITNSDEPDFIFHPFGSL
ncbi:MAG TPA: hypothetical protein VNH18_15090 [Bryobacteraceae bacterium]|nr:hypothetical protein [Bryobacteraceae bacterium]